MLSTSPRMLRYRARWQYLRLHGFQPDNPPKYLSCEVCNHSFPSWFVEVHHIDKNPENNNPANHIGLCRVCHLQAHGQEVIKYLPMWYKFIAAAKRRERKIRYERQTIR